MLCNKFQLNNHLRKVLSYDNSNKIKYSLWKKLCGKTAEPKKKPNEFEVFFPTINPNGIHNKVALVIGGGSGVGLSCVEQLLSNGARGVMIADNNERQGRKLLQKFCEVYGSEKISFIKTDVNDTVLLRNAYANTLKHLHELDIVVNNNRHFSCDSWERQIDYSIKGIVRNTLIAMEYMGTHNGGKGGVVVNVVTTSEQPKTECGIPLFVGAKHFTMGFDRSVAIQYFKLTGVKVMSLCPEDNSDDKDKMLSCENPAPNYDIVKLLSKANCGTMWT